MKIGKSKIDPAKGMAELTGVTTPSILVYREFFQEALDVAEKAIHDLFIESQISNQKQFFQLEPYKAIEGIQEVKNKVLMGTLWESTSKKDNPNYGYELFDEGCNYYYGRGNLKQDYGKAREIFLEAIQYGILPAYIYLGRMYEYGDGVTIDVQRALDYYSAGAKNGSTICHAKMASLYWRDTEVRDLEEGKKCWDKYFTSLDHRLVTKDDYANFNFYISLANENQMEIGYRNILGVYSEQMLRLLNIRKDICNEQHSDNLPFREYMLDVISREMDFVQSLEFVRPDGWIDDFAVASDLINITNMGVILLADVERGSFSVGDTIEVKAPGGAVFESVIRKIDKYREFVKSATKGESVGLLVDGHEQDLKFVKTGATIVVKNK
ncbi:hypothetical protein J2S74_000464 [Evansella vedderi]|uniref:Sel1 repeat family protein n=1 Tax=Evansella vedderi TaxID=38282 RepID=A0ABT9ZQT8_9BACI|nr:hypothetical protein [Evansella vedderi]